jgi:signal transduction histidine kinase
VTVLEQSGIPFCCILSLRVLVGNVMTQAGPMQGHYFDLVATEMSNRPIMLMEAERHRLARELHDDLLQTLTALRLSIDLCGRLSSSNDSAALEDELVQLKNSWVKSLSTMRELVVQSTPGSREHSGLREAMRHCALECERESNIAVSLDLGDLPERRLDGEQSMALSYIVREALRNTRHHACASRVLVRAENRADSLRVHIEDDGTGFDLSSVVADYPHRGLGLAGMWERAQSAGGQLSIESAPGRGTAVTLTLPLSEYRGS